MAYQIIDTTVGPIIFFKERYFTLGDTQELFGLLEEHPEALESLNTFLYKQVKEAVDEYLSALSEGLAVSPQRVFSYINVVNQFTTFKFSHWPQYQRAVSEALNAN